MKHSNFLSPLQNSVRQFNPDAIEFYLKRLLKQAAAVATSPRMRDEIYLEVVKALRVTGRTAEATQYADLAIANISAGTLDILAALKRIRAILFLDNEDYISARNIIEEADGLELILEGNSSLVTRHPTEVKVETWLVSVEIAMASGDLLSAQDYFNNAVSRLSVEETELRRKRINPMEKKVFEQYYYDLGQMLSLYGLTLSMMEGDERARAGLKQLFEQIASETAMATGVNKLPNVPLYSRLFCLVGRWSPDAAKPPGGLSLPEARRWANFARFKNQPNGTTSAAVGLPSANVGATEPAIAITGDSIENNEERGFVSNSSLEVTATPFSQSDKALDITASALERMASVFNLFENILPNVKSFLNNGDGFAADFTQRGFSGHLLDTDLFNFMTNFNDLKFTGLLKLKWDKDLYKPLVIKGILPPIVKCGEAVLYIYNGVVIDATFDGQSQANSSSLAKENFALVTRMCLSIGVDDIRPNIIGTAIPEETVTSRPPLLNVSVDAMLYIVTDIEAEIAGVSADESDKTPAIDDPPATQPVEEISEIRDESFELNQRLKIAQSEPVVDEVGFWDDAIGIPNFASSDQILAKVPVLSTEDLLEI